MFNLILLTTSFLEAKSAQDSSNNKFSGCLVVDVWSIKRSCLTGSFDCTDFSVRLLPTVYEKIKKYKIPFTFLIYF